MPRAEIFAVSSQFQILSLIAALESGVLGNADAHRVLLVSNNASVAETAQHPATSPVGEFARNHFAQLVDLNELLYPLKPVDFAPRPIDAPLLSKLFRIACGIGISDEVVLFVESIQSAPAKGLAEVFWDSELVVHADGLMVFGPSRQPLPPEMARRISTLSYPQVLPELHPLLLTEHNPDLAPTPLAALRRVTEDFIAWCARNSPDAEPAGFATGQCVRDGDALVLGQYLSDLNILTPEQNNDLSWDMVEAAAAHTDSRVVFKPHPSAAPSSTILLADRAASAGIDLVIDTSTLPVEVQFAVARPSLVVSAFSTGLVTAHFGYQIPVLCIGTELLLEQLRPFENSNRIPVTICDALFVHTPPIALPELVQAVAYAMQSPTLPHLRPAALSLVLATRALEAHAGQPHPGEGIVDNTEHQPHWRRYIKRRRAEAIGLIAKPSPAPSTTTAQRPSKPAVSLRTRLHKMLQGDV